MTMRIAYAFITKHNEDSITSIRSCDCTLLRETEISIKCLAFMLEYNHTSSQINPKVWKEASNPSLKRPTILRTLIKQIR